MKIFSLVLALCLLGCQSLNPLTYEFETKKTELEQKVELLRLEKRKLLLEKQIEAIESGELHFSLKDE